MSGFMKDQVNSMMVIWFTKMTKLFCEQIRFIQVRMKAKLATISSKQEVVRLEWQQALFHFYNRANDINDAKMLKALKMIMAVPLKIT